MGIGNRGCCVGTYFFLMQLTLILVNSEDASVLASTPWLRSSDRTREEEVTVPGFRPRCVAFVRTTTASAAAAAGARLSAGGMKNPSLADRMSTIVAKSVDHCKSHDFLERLRQEEKEQVMLALADEGKDPGEGLWFWKGVAGVSFIFLVIPSLLSTDAAISLLDSLDDLFKSLTSILWIPVFWIRPTSAALMDALLYFHLFSKPNVLRYMYHEVWPRTLRTARKMLFLELWNRFWPHFYQQVTPWMQALAGFGVDPDGADETSEVHPTEGRERLFNIQVPEWLHDVRAHLIRKLQKRMRTLTQIAVQKQVQDSAAMVYHVFTKALQVWLLNSLA